MRPTSLAAMACGAALALTGGCSLFGGGNDNQPMSNGVWSTVAVMNGAAAMPGDTTGLWFSSTSNGVVVFNEGLVEHFDGATHIDKIALDGHGMAAGGDDGYDGIIVDPMLGPIVTSDGVHDSIVTTSDGGKSFAYTKLFGMFTVPMEVQGLIDFSQPQLWIGKDGKGTWHVAERRGIGGGVWSSPTAPSASATFNLDWHPEGDIPVPDPIPAGDCMGWAGTGYWSTLPGQVFGASPDGNTMLYGTDSGEGACRSTDGGKNFKPIVPPANFSSHNYPWVIQWASNTVAIAAFGSDTSGPGTAYVLYTSDGGATWKQGQLPSSAAANASLIFGFASPTGTLFLGGENDAGLLLYKSSDGGATWTDIGANLAAFAKTVGNPPLRLRAGFALDDKNLWVGGDNAFVAYTSTGGQ